jgi:hypothetical protein
VTHAEASPNTFALVAPLLADISHLLHRQDQQIATIAATHAALMLLTRIIRRRETPALRAGLNAIDDMLAALYDGYELSLASQTKQ